MSRAAFPLASMLQVSGMRHSMRAGMNPATKRGRGQWDENNGTRAVFSMVWLRGPPKAAMARSPFQLLRCPLKVRPTPSGARKIAGLFAQGNIIEPEKVDPGAVIHQMCISRERRPAVYDSRRHVLYVRILSNDPSNHGERFIIMHFGAKAMVSIVWADFIKDMPSREQEISRVASSFKFDSAHAFESGWDYKAM